MTRESYVFKNGSFQPAEKQKLRVKTLVGDEMIDGVEHPATREVIYSRSKFKSISKAHGLEECYGESEKYWQREDDSEKRGQDLEEDVLKSLADLNYGEGITEEELELCKQKNQRMEWEAEQ